MKTIIIYINSLALIFGITNCTSQSFKEKKEETKNILSVFSEYQPTIFSLEDSSILRKKRLPTFYYHDSLYRGVPFVINKNETKLFLTRPTLICETNQDQVLYLIYPGEHVYLRINKNNEPIFFIEKGEQRNNELIFFKDLIHRYGRLYNFLPSKPYHSKFENIEAIERAAVSIYDLKRQRQNFLDSFSGTGQISSSFKKIALNVIKSAALKDSLLLYWNNRELLKKKNVYENFLSEKIETIKRIEFQPYLVYQGAAVSLLSMVTTPYISYELQTTSDLINRFNEIQKQFEGILKDFLLANTLISSYDLGIVIPDDLVTRFKQQCSDSFYRETVLEIINSTKKAIKVEDFDKLISADNKTIIDIRSLISKYKGKVIVMDFWASWCLPCREELPASFNLKNYFKEKDVAFIYLSSDKNVEDWKKSMQQEEMNPSENFIFLDARKSGFLKRFNIITIPRYMIINKKGQIVESDAPRPSEPNLKKIIEKYLRN